jgi:GTP-binding protein
MDDAMMDDALLPDADTAEHDATPARADGDPLVIHSVDFLGGMASAGGWRPDPILPEVAFSGRSNVGKSSLLNKLVRRRKMARVSNTPGRTREINFFDVNHAMMFVDLPGYGFARASKEMRGAWRALIEGYLRTSPQLRGIVQLMDARREPSPDDLQMLDFLAELGVPTIIAVTKIDKLRAREVPEKLAAIVATLGVDDEQLVPFSAVTGAGRDERASAVVSLVTQPPWRTS